MASSKVNLVTADKDGNRLVHNAETNLGDLCAEAFRSNDGLLDVEALERYIIDDLDGIIGHK